MSRARYLIGDVFERMAEIPDGSIDLVVTSPPFLALRSYLPADHPDKAKEIGSEPTPAAFLDTLLALTAEWRRVLAPHGSIAVELGDTYSGNGGENHLWDDGYSGGRKGNNTKKPAGAGAIRNMSGGAWPLDKSLSGIPTLYAWSLAYGRNLLNPDTTCEPWRIRNLLVWARPNPPVGALGDKWRPATSYVTVACVGRSRYFDLDAVRTPSDLPASPGGSKHNHEFDHERGDSQRKKIGGGIANHAGAPPLDWCDERGIDWQPLMPLPTQPYAGSHYATFPSQLPKRLIECMCPSRVCTVCGKPSVRIVESSYVGAKSGASYKPQTWSSGIADGGAAHTNKPPDEGARVVTETLGWTDCGCSADGTHWRNGLVLDPFGGSGTTAVAATGLGRDAILIDIDERNAELARDRVGMFLEVEG